MLLYNSQVSGNCYKVRLLLAHLGLEYERQELSVANRSNRPEVLGGLNPALRVPTLVLDDGRSLGESGAIIWFFGEGTRFVPDDPYERAQVLQCRNGAASRRTHVARLRRHDSRRHRALRVHARRGRGGFEIDRYPAIGAWLLRVASEPGHVPIDA